MFKQGEEASRHILEYCKIHHEILLTPSLLDAVTWLVSGVGPFTPPPYPSTHILGTLGAGPSWS